MPSGSTAGSPNDSDDKHCPIGYGMFFAECRCVDFEIPSPFLPQSEQATAQNKQMSDWYLPMMCGLLGLGGLGVYCLLPESRIVGWRYRERIGKDLLFLVGLGLIIALSAQWSILPAEADRPVQSTAALVFFAILSTLCVVFTVRAITAPTLTHIGVSWAWMTAAEIALLFWLQASALALLSVLAVGGCLVAFRKWGPLLRDLSADLLTGEAKCHEPLMSCIIGVTVCAVGLLAVDYVTRVESQAALRNGSRASFPGNELIHYRLAKHQEMSLIGPETAHQSDFFRVLFHEHWLSVGLLGVLVLLTVFAVLVLLQDLSPAGEPTAEAAVQSE